MAATIRIEINSTSGGKGIEDAKHGIVEIGEASDRAGGRISALGSMAQGIFQGIGQAAFNAAVGGVEKLAGGLFDLAKTGIIQNASMEQTETAFGTLLGSGEKAADFLGKLRDFAAATPFEFPELAESSKKLLAMGFTAEDVLPMMTNIGDAVGALGGGAPEVDRVVMALGQMQAKGKVSAEEMNQLTELGIPAWKLLADSMGLSVEQVMDLSKKGLLPADEAVQNLLGGMQNTFGGSMAAQAQTFNGLLSTVKDNLGLALQTMTGPLFEAAKGGLTELGNLIASPAFQAFAQQIGQNIGAAIGQFAGWLTNVGLPALRQFADWVQTVAIPALASMEPWFASTIPGAIASAQSAFQGISNFIASVMPSMMGIIQSTLTIVSALWQQHGAQWMQQAQSVFTIIQGVIQVVMGVIQGILAVALGLITGDWTTAMQQISSANETIWNGIKNILMGILDNIASYFGTTADKVLTDWATGLAQLSIATTTAVNNALEALRAAIAPAAQIGKAIIDGIVSGVTSAAGNLANAAANAAKAALDAAKDALGIKSPSTVFAAQVGMPMAQGMALGLQQGAPMVAGAAQGVAQSAVAGATTNVTNYNYSPTYSSTPSNPSADFRMMQSLATAGT